MPRNSLFTFVALSTSLMLTVLASGCGKDEPASSQQALFYKYGGLPTIQKVVDDAVAGLTTDPQISGTFAVIGQPGHDSVDRLKSCLDQQFSALFGGRGYNYPANSSTRPNPPSGGYPCEDMVVAHTGLGLTSANFDRFITDLTGVLAADGVSTADINAVAPTLLGLKSSIINK